MKIPSSYRGFTSEEQKSIEKEFAAECLELYKAWMNGQSQRPQLHGLDTLHLDLVGRWRWLLAARRTLTRTMRTKQVTSL